MRWSPIADVSARGRPWRRAPAPRTGPARRRLYRVGVSVPESPLRRPEPSAPKDAWRRWALRGRRARSAAEIAAARTAITDHLLHWSPLAAATTVCSYLPLPTEPLGGEVSDTLHRLGHRVLVPVTGVDVPLRWAGHRPDGPRSLGVGRVPDQGPPLSQAQERRALLQVSLVLVPALLVARDGTRLGRGGGHYDRSFARTALGSAAVRMAVVFDDEFTDALPSEPHDAVLTAVVSPRGGIRMIPLP